MSDSTLAEILDQVIQAPNVSEETIKAVSQLADDWSDDHCANTGVAFKMFNRLLIDYSLSENSTHVGTGLGGNPSMLVFLLSRNVLWKQKLNYTVGTDPQISDDPQTNTLTIGLTPEHTNQVLDGKFDYRALREGLEKAVPPNTVPQFTMKDISDPSFWTAQNIKSSSSNVVKLLISALERTKKFMETVNAKTEIVKRNNDLVQEECALLKTEFLTEIGLPDIDPRVDEGDDWIDYSDLMLSMDDYAKKNEALEKTRIEANLLAFTRTDVAFFRFLTAIPLFIFSIVMGRKIGLDQMMRLELDVHPQLNAVFDAMREAMVSRDVQIVGDVEENEE